MISDITFGQYYPGKSVLHRMDPRMKLSLTFAMIIVLFLCKNFLSLGLTVLFTVAAVIFSGVHPKVILKSIKPIVLILIFTAALNIFYTKGGEVYFEWWKIQITEKGVNTALFTMIRITALVVISSLLTYTTTPTALTDALERLLSPLNVLHIRVHTLAMMMTLALRFIPTLIEEIERIMNAQKARGADLETGGFIQRVKALIPIFIPLMISSFRRAYELAFAMTCRCYTGGEGRTRMKQMKLAARDFICLFICILVTAGVIVLNIFFEAVI
uniref:ABC-type cobalt transport system, permease component CbiQ and related transporters n=1 Tax=uncultured bacterium Contig137 TaxID=1393421 RepID=W0FPK4_9BACT|nr:ABC-type cobalt transport system, permease component CbiQ and related transporters [uncultured bacterium Contig137]